MYNLYESLPFMYNIAYFTKDNKYTLVWYSILSFIIFDTFSINDTYLLEKASLITMKSSVS